MNRKGTQREKCLVYTILKNKKWMLSVQDGTSKSGNRVKRLFLNNTRINSREQKSTTPSSLSLEERRRRGNPTRINYYELNMYKLIYLVITLIIIAEKLHASSDEKPAGNIHGYVFGDYYYMLGSDTAQKRGNASYSSLEENMNGFMLRRMFLYYDYNISDDVTSQILFETNEKSLDGNGHLGFFLKTAYVEWNDVIPNHSLSLGLIPSPTWVRSVAEKTWGYRVIEKTIVDLHSLGSGSDMGIAMRGNFRDNIGYNIMLGNGNGQKPENNKYKKMYANVNFKSGNFLFEANGDYEPDAHGKEKTTMQFFTGFRIASLMFGAQAMEQIQKKFGANDEDIIPAGISVFGSVYLNPQFVCFARVDFFNPDTKSDAIGYYETFTTFGFDYFPIKEFHIMPNFWLNVYKEKNKNIRKQSADIAGRMTFLFIFK